MPLNKTLPVDQQIYDPKPLRVLRLLLRIHRLSIETQCYVFIHQPSPLCIISELSLTIYVV